MIEEAKLEYKKKEFGSGMKNERYSMAFTTGGLFHRGSVKLAVLYLELKEWDSVRNKVFSENLLQSRTLNSLTRVSREIISRLKTLEAGELDLLISGSTQEQKYLLWLAVCRRYSFIADFAKEVIRERYISLKSDLHYEEFDYFFNKKSEWYPELEKITPTTRNKLRQVLFKILREAEILTIDHTINGSMLSKRLLDAISQERRKDVLIFPAFASGITGIAT